MLTQCGGSKGCREFLGDMAVMAIKSIKTYPLVHSASGCILRMFHWVFQRVIYYVLGVTVALIPVAAQ